MRVLHGRGYLSEPEFSMTTLARPLLLPKELRERMTMQAFLDRQVIHIVSFHPVTFGEEVTHVSCQNHRD
jgi:hypothetical protein